MLTWCLLPAMLLPACGKTPKQSGEATMPSESFNPSSAPSGGDYTLEYTVRAMPGMGELQRIDTTLRIDSAKRTAWLEKHRSQSDRAGEPIGTFGGELSEKLIGDILAAVRKAKLDDLPPRSGRGPGSTIITLKFQRGGEKTEAVFSTGDMEILDALEGLLDELNQLAELLNDRAICAMKASVEFRQRPQPHFVLTLRNIGTERICFGDPRLLTAGSAVDVNHWAGVRVAVLPEEKPHVTSPPLQWVRLPLAGPRAGSAGETIVLKPGKTFSADTVAWPAWQKGVTYLAQGVWTDYTGPGEVQGVFRVRGATFSEGLTLK